MTRGQEDYDDQDEVGMKIFPLFLLAATLAHGALSRQIANYDIQATLDHKTHVVSGSEVLTWVNDSPDSVPTLQFLSLIHI